MGWEFWALLALLALLACLLLVDGCLYGQVKILKAIVFRNNELVSNRQQEIDELKAQLRSLETKLHILQNRDWPVETPEIKPLGNKFPWHIQWLCDSGPGVIRGSLPENRISIPLA